MIISQIIGGLGNQMFQFAAGQALANKLNLEHRIDISGFENYQLHKYQLGRVFVGMEEATPTDLHNLIGWQSNNIAKKIVAKPQFSWVRSRNFVVEPHLTYWPGFDQLNKPSYLVGYWQSEKYFSASEHTTHTFFAFSSPLSQRNQQIVKEIKNSQAVSIHIRRGDYVLDRKKLAFHGVCSLDYYHNAITYLTKRIKTPKFFIFSDDMDWVKKNLQIKYDCIYVDHNTGLESYNDMRLMSQCNHNIVANSSFSWWAAWLNANTCKIVIAPKKWYANQSNSSDLCPATWVKL